MALQKSSACEEIRGIAHSLSSLGGLGYDARTGSASMLISQWHFTIQSNDRLPRRSM